MTTFEEEIKCPRSHQVTDSIVYGSQGIITWMIHSEALGDFVPVSLDTLKSRYERRFMETEERLIRKYDELMAEEKELNYA